MKRSKFFPVVWLALSFTALSAQVPGNNPYIGSWSLDLDYESSNVGWLEVMQKEGYLDANLLWRWGSVEPVEFVFQMDNNLILTKGRDVVREKDRNGDPVRMQHITDRYEITQSGEEEITGTAYFPKKDGSGVEKITFAGHWIPPVEGTPDPKNAEYGKSIRLFDGKDLSGWKLVESNRVNGWKVKDGALVNEPVQKKGEEHISYGNLRTVDTFEDFNLKLQVKVPEGSNSGVYLRGMYEIQVLDSYGLPRDSHNMGALYSRITPSVSAEKPAGSWQDLNITLYKRHVTVILNGETIIDNQPVRGVTGGAISSDEFKPGPIFLQGDHGAVSYRNIVLTPII